jgi:hypothetical protein
LKKWDADGTRPYQLFTASFTFFGNALPGLPSRRHTVSQRQRRGIFIENQPTKNPKLRQEQHRKHAALDGAWFVRLWQNYQHVSPDGLPLRLGVLALKNVLDLPYRLPSYQA